MNTLFEMNDPKPNRPKVQKKFTKPVRRGRRSTPPEFAILPTVSEFPPIRFARIFDGPVLPDDLVWSIMAREWKRADDPGWSSPAILAEDCQYVIRPLDNVRPEGDRNYTIRR